MARLIFFSVFYILFILLDVYVYRGLRLSFPFADKPILKLVGQIAYWAVPAVLSFMLLWFFVINANQKPSTAWILAFTGVFILFYVPKLILLVFNGASDLVKVAEWMWHKIQGNGSERKGFLISRKEFLRICGTIIAAVPFFSILYGIMFGRYDYKVENKQIKSPKLKNQTPIRVVQISDAHLGSFLEHKTPVIKAIQAINELKADVVVFTGDLVNDLAEEAEPWIKEFKSIEAKYAKLSILGNHDYGDYFKWASEEAKKANLDRLKEIHAEMGFDLLLNESREIEIDGQIIDLAGVENWGLPPFPQHGDLNKAISSWSGERFSILLSHDPTHFDEEVVKHPKKADITLSGHTHGMQFGLIFGNFQWSPVQYKYKKWAGMYADKAQKLYVNRGFGYIGFPGRVGMPPEISVFDLISA